MSAKLEIKTAFQVAKPANDVFDAIIDPSRMSNYFISQSTGKMEEGERLHWRFPEFDMDVPIRVGKIKENEYISYSWEYNKKELLVEITLTPAHNNTTIVTITEKEMENDEDGIKWLKSNTEGWANFLACLKAYLEYGINLRKGGFDFMRK